MIAGATSRADCDVVVVGEYYCDLIYHDLVDHPELGREVLSAGFDMVPGGSFTPVSALHKLGVNVLWQCGIGNDPYSKFILDEARRIGLREDLFTHTDQPLRRVTSVFSMLRDRGFLTFVDGPDPIASVENICGRAPKICLFQGLSTLLPNLDLARALRATGAQIISDCGHTELTLRDPRLSEALNLVDIFLPNADEARQITGMPAAADALENLIDLCSSVVIKRGAEGAIGSSEGARFQIPPLPVTPVDLTGAGDCFNAGFVFGLCRGETFEAAMVFGNVLGALSTLDLGGRALPDKEHLIADWKAFWSKDAM